MPDIEVPQGDFTFAEERKLLEERAALWNEHRTALGKESLSAEEDAAYAARDSKIEELTKRLERGLALRKANAVDSEVVEERADRTGMPADEHRELFNKYLRVGLSDMQPQEREKLQAQFRVQNTVTGSAGGFLVPDGFWNRLVEQMKAFGPIESVVNVITTSTGNDLPWLTNDDTSIEGELLNEGDQVSNQDLVFASKVLRAYTYSSKMILVSWQLLQDSVIDIEGLIARAAATRLARIHSRHFTTGDGINKPEGITVGLTGGETLASGTTIDYADLINIQHILDPAYRGGNQRWMFNDATLKLVRNLVDGQGNRAWQPSLQQGIPDRILGDPYIINQSMPLPTTGQVSILYGDFNAGYIVRRVKGATAVRLNEKYADFLQTGYFVYDRVDGKKDVTSAYTYGIQA